MDATESVLGICNGRKLLSALWHKNWFLAVVLTVIIGLALGLRFYGLDWDQGYGYTPHPDERAILGKVSELSPPALGQLGLLFDADESPWNPEWFPYGSFPLYLLKGVQLIFSTWPGVELNDLRIAGRAISALADVGTVGLVYLLGSRVYGRREGLLASALVALAVIHIQLSHFYTVDTLLGLFTVAALYFLYRVAMEGRLKESLLAGAIIGLGLATKVSQMPIYIALIMGHLLYAFSAMGRAGGPAVDMGVRLRTALKGLAAGAAASLVVFLIVQPYTLLDWSRFLEDVVEQSEMVRRMRDYPYTRQYIDTTPYWYHIRQLATWGLGWPLGAVAWVGLLYASLRGMRLTAGLTYLAVGMGVPIALLLYSTSFFVILLASGIAFVALVATLPFRSVESKANVLILSWVAPYYLITGAFEVKFIRYLVPITPLLILFGSRMLIALWDSVKMRRPSLRPWLVAGLVLLLGSTGLYALSYTAVYSQPHTAVRTSGWINLNAPKGAIILNEHWEEGLPGLGDYEVRTLPLYDDDSLDKLRSLSENLAEADYILFFSNRLYGTIPRLPERYPVTSQYYHLLFSGALGYELANVETAYPRLAGLSIAADTFGSPNLPRPPNFDSFRPKGMTLNLGFADESFSVYDHPMGLVFKNVEHRDAEAIRRSIEEAVSVDAFPAEEAEDLTPTGLRLSPEVAETQRRGGTWSEIVREESWTNRFPILAWLLLVEGVALLMLPITFSLFRPLADRGYLFSKTLGILGVALVVWLLASVQWVSFSRESITVAVLVLAAASTVVLARKRAELVAFVRERWPVIVVGEALFLVAFFSFVMVRMANPDLWHPWLGGEKPMDLAYLNATLKSSYMPPYDPWFAGGYLNYYYWGQFIVAMLIKATGIDTPVAYNLAVALFFALTVAGAFTIVFSLAEGTRRSLIATPSGTRGVRWSPVLAGLTAGMFVTVVGNLDGAVQVGQGVWRAVFLDLPFGEFDFWRSSRMMSPGNEITEFPFFTFLFADLHAHLMAIPFTLLALGLVITVVAGASGVRQGQPMASLEWRIGELARLAVFGVVVGALRPINAWDYPTYMILAAAAVFLAAYFRRGGLSLMVLLESGIKTVLVFLVGYLVFLPFHLKYEAFVTSLKATTNQTILWQFLSIAGLFIFIICSFYIRESRDWLLPVWHALRGRAVALARVPARGRDATLAPIDRERIRLLRVAAIILAAVTAGYVVATMVSGWTGSTIPFLVAMVVLVGASGLRSLRSERADAPYLTLVALIVAVALALAIGLDIYRVEGDIDRMNSVFKFYLQIWVLLALASSYLLWRILYENWKTVRTLTLWLRWWLVALAVLVVSSSVYPILGTQARLRNRFDVQPLTLDGMAYMRDAVYPDANGKIRLSSDYDGIRWLQSNVQGSPIILEGSTPMYRWGGRISVYTGLPSVVGWQWHQEQQRWGYRHEVGERIDDVNRIYSTTEAAEALALLRRYGVSYVYVGQLERLYYPGDGLRKFEDGLGGHLYRVYHNEDVAVYRLRWR